MAFTDGPARVRDTHGRRRPFANWMKRLANLKSLHVESSQNPNRRRLDPSTNTKSKTKNNPYPLSTRLEPQIHAHPAISTPLSSQRSRHSSYSHSKKSTSISHESQLYNKSRAPTLATTAETTISEAATSGAGTTTTAGRTDGDRNSTFSSPSPSLRSVTTTLTTVQSAAPPNHTGTPQYPGATNISNTTSSNLPTQPATAIPPHLAPHSNFTTYQSATANNILTDDASILTLASSSKRRRRNSVDTNASVKALAPASMFGGSRESLPLSVLSGTVIHTGAMADTASLRDASSSIYPRSVFNAERASLISASGVTAPALASERNSYIGSKHGDGASIRSGLLGAGGGHGRTDSITGSVGGGRENRDYRDRDRERELPGIPSATSPLVEAEVVYYDANDKPQHG